MKGRRAPLAVAVAMAVAGSFALTGPAFADDSPPGNLGNGLGRLVDPQPARGGVRLTNAPLAIRDRAGRVLVDVYARNDASLAAVRQRAESAGLQTVTQAATHKALEGFVAIADVKKLARTAGVASVSQALRPFTKVGAATSQGVRAERADRLPRNIDGRGVTVGALSDSFDTATTTVDGQPLDIHAAQDIKTGDLPREGVTVIEDTPPDVGADEGRAMLQIVHDVAPGARECFATAFNGQLGFADNIRRLADKGGPCGADVIVDDVGYFDEPFFGESIIGDAVDDVAAQGVHYFSSAGNGSSQQAYAAPLRIVAPDTATEGTNLSLEGVDPALYAGGFHDFDPGDGVDVAQDLALGAVDGEPGDGIIDFQWDDPVDPNGAPLSDPVFETTGEITAADPVAEIPFAGSAGQTIRGLVDAVPSGTTDFILTLKDPAQNVLQVIDTNTSPEVLVQTLAQTGTYTFEVSGFEGDLGDFTFEVRNVLGASRTTTDLNVLLFDPDGNFLFALNDLNRLSGHPFEIAGLAGAGGLQMAVSKANTDGGQATQIRYQLEAGLQYDEYVQPLAPSTFGHPLARGATAVAAYDPFRPLLPEDYTSVGGDLPVLFDSAGNRLAQPSIRRVPQVAATDGGNTTFFTVDSTLDGDDQPNFFGTSASAPHAAAIAALAQQARGRLSPTAMRALLERSAFPHDLDPQHSDAAAGGLTISADGPLGSERRNTRPTWTTTGSMTDPTFFEVGYSGPGSIVSLTFDGRGANPTGFGNGGIVFDPRPFIAIPALGGPNLYDQGFPFTVGAASAGIDPDSITATFARPGFGQATKDQFRQMTVSFPAGALGGGRSVAFGIDRDEAVTAHGIAEDGNSADQLGQGVLFPEGDVVGPGLEYTAVTSTGRVLRGFLRNRVGAGWTPVDGFGYLNAEAAVGRARGGGR